MNKNHSLDNRTISLEWQVTDDEMVWEEMDPSMAVDRVNRSGDHTSSSVPRWHRTTLVAAVSVSLFLLIIAGFPLWRMAKNGVQQIHTEVATAVAVEDWSRNAEKLTPITALGEAEASTEKSRHTQHERMMVAFFGDMQTTVQDLYFRDQMVMARVQITLPQSGADQPLRATRFYRQVDGQWEPIPPHVDFWGTARTLETTYFRFYFRQEDADAVMSVSEWLDDFYVQLRQDVALPPVSIEGLEKRVIVVDTDAPNLSRPLYFHKNRLNVPSPLLLMVPRHMTDAEILADSIVQPLIASVMQESTRQATVNGQFSALKYSLHLWQFYATGTPSAGQQNFQTWLYRDAQALRDGTRTPSPIDRWALCHIVIIWDTALPLDLTPWSLCVEMNWEEHLRQMEAPPFSLYAIEDGVWRLEPSQGKVLSDWIQLVAAMTLVEYLVETYGRAQLPVLVQGMRQHVTFDELMRDTFGVSAEEVEAGWQNYLVEQYGYRAD